MLLAPAGAFALGSFADCPESEPHPTKSSALQNIAGPIFTIMWATPWNARARSRTAWGAPRIGLRARRDAALFSRENTMLEDPCARGDPTCSFSIDPRDRPT
jgi:hypothetical protein